MSEYFAILAVKKTISKVTKDSFRYSAGEKNHTDSLRFSKIVKIQ